MKRYAPIVVVIVMALLADARGQALQLPTIEYFASEGSVLVPDQGRASQAGVNRAASGRSQFGGLPGSVATGLNRQAVGSSVTAHVHDFEALDKSLLRTAAARRRALAGGGFAESPFSETTTPAPGGSLAQIETDQRHRRELEQAEVLGLVDRADRALAAQKPNVARIYLKMAARRASGPLKNRIARQLAALEAVSLEAASIEAAPIEAVPIEKTAARR